MSDWQTLFPAGIVFAIGGGILGALGAFEQGHGTWQRVCIEAAIAAVLAAAVAENYLPLVKAWLCGGFGVGVGLVAGYVLDAVKAVAPDTVRRLAERLAKRYAPDDKTEGKP